ncbi:NTF2-like protein [Mycena amicta]|nr:NTF2-like protein [Mycena amicta]
MTESPPASYDPNSPSEQPVPLPCAPQVALADGIVLQPPLTRRGTGPGLIAFLPPLNLNLPESTNTAPLDPFPVQKWAEEGFAVAGITSGSVEENVKTALDGLVALQELDTRDKFAVAVYDPTVLLEVLSVVATDDRLVCLVVYGYPLPAGAAPNVPTLVFLPSGTEAAAPANLTVCKVDAQSPSFVLPQTVHFHSGAASIAHSKATVHIKKYLAGPFFDLEAIWEEHTLFEFQVRSVAQTMGTMVAEPYVNHVPTLAGGIGRTQLSAFYRDHFIFSNPKDTWMQSISRTVGSDRVVDEFIFHCTHDQQIDWLLPGVPPTGKRLAIPMLAVVNIRGDRLYHEHIWWDQGTACMQADIIPTHVQFDGKTLRLPIAGVESATLLADESAVPPNEMMGPAYGVSQEAPTAQRPE